MEKLHLKDGYSIYFADVYFDDVIYSMGTGLGFTDVIYGYSLGRDQQEAEQLVTEKVTVHRDGVDSTNSSGNG
ncbi:hypothetical protein [Aeromonas dhakensis]|uniref:hypothetical protein n=1 Tax=Aeromonas dhakensis TaxID=196024 RepID=UPI003987FE65